MKSKKRYTVFWSGGDRDGEMLYETNDYCEATTRANELWKEHETEFDPCWGGIGITDNETEEIVEW